MDMQNVARLSEVQQFALCETSHNIHKLKHYVEDYTSVKKLVEKLPDEISYDVMVPIGNLAFMPGFLEHTNEILLLLGDNWFTLRSAKQTSDVVTRRIAGLKEQIVGLEQQKKTLSSKASFTSELFNTDKDDDVCEITEVFDEVEEQTWKEQHQKNLKKYHFELSKMRSTHQNNSKPDVEFQQIWQRLEDLEKEEDELLELSSEMDIRNTEAVCDKVPTSLTKTGTMPKTIMKNVKWQDQHRSTNENENFDDSVTAASEIKCPIITFRHTTFVSKAETFDTTDEKAIATPADICQQFFTPSRSILEDSTASHDLVRHGFSNKLKMNSSSSDSSLLLSSNPNTSDVVSSVVLERNVPGTSQTSATVQQQSSLASDVKSMRVSKFKATRLSLNSK